MATKKSTKKLSFRKTSPLKMLLAVVVVTAVAGIGTYLLTRSNAATAVGPRMYMANRNDTQDPAIQFDYGIWGDKYVAGDWDGNGSDTLGVRRGNEFLLANASPAAAATNRFTFGEATDKPIAGDWNGDKTSTVGVFRPSDGKFYLRNTNTGGAADVTTIKLGTGLNDQVPLACDWNGDGITDLGLFRLPTAEWQIFISGQQAGAPWLQTVPTFVYGSPGDQPVCGDWDSNKTATLGIYRGDTFYLKNTNDAGPGWPQRFGEIGFLPLVGRWISGNATTFIGAYSVGSDAIADPIATTPATSTTIDGTADQCAQKTLRNGNTGTCITILQNYLADRQFPVDNGELTGKTFGQSTFNKVKEFQLLRRNTVDISISVDGVVGPQTWKQLTTDTKTPDLGALSPTLPTLAANMAGAPENKDDPVKYCQALSAAILKVVQNADAIEAIFDVRWKPESNSLWRNGVGTTIGTRLFWTDKKVRLNTLTYSDCTKRDSLITQNINRLDQAKALKGQLNNAYGTLLAKILLGQ